jgi:hypothetical protein
MSTIRQYFDTDFDYALRINFLYSSNIKPAGAKILYDMNLGLQFLSFYFDDPNISTSQFEYFLSSLKYGFTQLEIAGTMQLPSLSHFHGEINVRNDNVLEIEYQLFGDPVWRNLFATSSTGRVFIYAETIFSFEQIERLQSAIASSGKVLQFRDRNYERERTMLEKPLAFISHDSGDKESIARPIAQNLQSKLCPVWYDEYSLSLGSNLRESIEKGLKETRKCVLILSKKFIYNRGWGKKEFDSVFTREILEDKKVVLPIWCDVTKEQVYEYSPSLLNIKGISWDALGEEEVCRQIYLAVTSADN